MRTCEPSRRATVAPSRANSSAAEDGAWALRRVAISRRDRSSVDRPNERGLLHPFKSTARAGEVRIGESAVMLHEFHGARRDHEAPADLRCAAARARRWAGRMTTTTRGVSPCRCGRQKPSRRLRQIAASLRTCGSCGDERDGPIGAIARASPTPGPAQRHGAAFVARRQSRGARSDRPRLLHPPEGALRLDLGSCSFDRN